LGNDQGYYQAFGLQTVQMVKKQRKESAQGATPAPVQCFCEKQRTVRLRKVCTFENPCESSMKKSIGKPCERKLHARFDEGGTDSLHLKLIFEIGN